MFNNGGTLNFGKKWFGLKNNDPFVKVTQPPLCGNLTYYDDTKQFQYNADKEKCIGFFGNQKPRVHGCHICCGNYIKATPS